MSILIKGMEMPTCCNNCWFYDDRRCYLFSNGVPNRYNYDALTMPDWCELIEIPPHGRLIDADAATKQGWIIERIYSASPSEHVCEVKGLYFLPTIIEAEKGE